MLYHFSMMTNVTASFLILLVACAAFSTPGAVAAPLKIVAAETVYGAIAERMAGDHAEVVSLLTNPDQDPHDFEPGANVAKILAGADIVIENGAGYDAWVDKLLAASPSKTRRVLNIAALTHRALGQNPHLWYNPRSISALAAALTVELETADPTNAASFEKNRDKVMNDIFPLLRKIGALQDAYRGVPIAATEPVFDEMANAIGLKVMEDRFALAVMNGSEPRASDIAAFEDDLKQRRVAAMIFNTQTQSPVISRLRDLAGENKIPVIGVSESMPTGATYESWMLGILDQLEPALQHAPPH